MTGARITAADRESWISEFWQLSTKPSTKPEKPACGSEHRAFERQHQARNTKPEKNSIPWSTGAEEAAEKVNFCSNYDPQALKRR
jgi:hypothetical protein